MNKRLSGIKDIHAFIIRPVGDKGIVTMQDQRKLLLYTQWKGAKFSVIHFSPIFREETVERIRLAKLSKPMLVTEITDAQWARRGKDKETIPNTGVHATKKQLESSFVIGEKK